MAQATARHILVETEEECLSLKEQIENGLDFAEAAKNKETGERKIFFNLGPKNNWEKLLDIEFKEDIEKEFKTEMCELGYI